MPCWSTPLLPRYKDKIDAYMELILVVVSQGTLEGLKKHGNLR